MRYSHPSASKCKHTDPGQEANNDRNRKSTQQNGSISIAETWAWVLLAAYSEALSQAYLKGLITEMLGLASFAKTYG